MKVRYIAIEREYGSGGTKIAQETARRCGLACYGREILEAVAKEHHLSVEELENYEEKVSSSFLYSMFVVSQSQTGDPDLLSGEAKLLVAEERKIRALAQSGPAVFVGHSAADALKDCDGVLRIFSHAEDASKRSRIIEDYHIPAPQVDAVCTRVNKRRANYYSFCTRKKWNDLRNYDIVLDSSRLGIDGCAAALSALYAG